MKEKEILPFVTTWMDLEDIMLCGMSGRERQILYDSTYVESEKAEFIESDSRMVIIRGWGVGVNGEMLVKGYKPPVTR